MQKNKIIRIILFSVIFVMLPYIASADSQFWFENGSHKIRQSEVSNNQSSIDIKAAQNEFEPFQLAIKNTDVSDWNNVDVSISDFTGAGTISSSNVTIFKEHYLDIINLSTIEGQTGEWPDALLPKVDAYYHETRNTFPVNISPGRIQPIWFDVFIPANSAPGNYTATVTVTKNSATVFSGTVNLEVWDFNLPESSSFPTHFGLGMDNTWQGHFGGTWPIGGMVAITDLIRTYARAGLRHRLNFSLMPITFGTWNGTDYDSVSATYFNQSSVGFFGDGDPNIEYGQSEISKLNFNFVSVYRSQVIDQGMCEDGTIIPPAGLAVETRKRAERIYEVLTPAQRNIAAILPIDEPGGGEVGCGAANAILDYNSVKVMAQEIKAAGLKVYITKSRRDELLNTGVTPSRNDYIDRWVPWLGNVIGRHWDGSHIDTRNIYDEDIANGAELWWYQSCMTHGCEITGGSSFSGNPQYMVEYSAMHNRIFPWMSFKYDIGGEQYFAVTGQYGSDPWSSIWDYGGNGDGIFFYPGVPDKSAVGLPYNDRGTNTPNIGGTHQIPIESIRLKMIREGYEDYEYLNILKNLGADIWAKNEVDFLVTNTYMFNSNEDDMYVVREALADQIELLSGSSDTTPPQSPGGLAVW